MKTLSRLASALGAAVVAATMLTACAALPTPAPTSASAPAPISQVEAGALLNALSGIRDASVGSVISGLSTEAIIELSVDDDSSITAPGVLDYILRVGWATSVANEPSQLSLTVWSNGTRLDLQPEANVLAGVDYPAFPLLHSVHLDAPKYLGAWPGGVPTPPTG